MEAGLLSSLQRTSSIQGLLGQQLSSSQLSFSGSVAPPPLPGPERFCPASLLDNSGHRGGQRAGLGQGGGLHYESHFGKWSFSGRKGFNGPTAAEGEGGTVQTIRTQVRTRSLTSPSCFSCSCYCTSSFEMRVNRSAFSQPRQTGSGPELLSTLTGQTSPNNVSYTFLHSAFVWILITLLTACYISFS